LVGYHLAFGHFNGIIWKRDGMAESDLARDALDVGQAGICLALADVPGAWATDLQGTAKRHPALVFTDLSPAQRSAHHHPDCRGFSRGAEGQCLLDLGRNGCAWRRGDHHPGHQVVQADPRALTRNDLAERYKKAPPSLEGPLVVNCSPLEFYE